MSYINLNTGQYPLSLQQVKASLPDTSFPFELAEIDKCLPDLGYAKVQPTAAPVVPHTKNLVEGVPELDDGTYYQTWVVEDATQEEIDDRTESQASSVRDRRNYLLTQSDWTQIPDAVSAGADQTQWSEYRQLLREIPSQPGFPWDVTWPEEPAVVPPSGRIDYRQFYDNLIASPIYMVIRQKAVSDVVMLTACVEFIAAISDAKSGRPNVAAIQTCINLLCAAAQFTLQERDMLAEAMEVGGMDRIYTLP